MALPAVYVASAYAWNPGELDSMRAYVVSSFTDTATILTKADPGTAPHDQYGGVSTAGEYTAGAAPVACRLVILRHSDEADVADEVMAKAVYHGFFPYGTVIRPQDRVQHSSGAILEVMNVQPLETDALNLVTVLAEIGDGTANA